MRFKAEDGNFLIWSTTVVCGVSKKGFQIFSSFKHRRSWFIQQESVCK